MFGALRRLLRRWTRRLKDRSPVVMPAARAPDEADQDPVGSAVMRGLASRGIHGKAYRLEAVHKAARRYFARDVPSVAPDEALAQLLGFVEVFPDDEQLQILAGRMLDRSSFRATAPQVWIGIHNRFPESSPASARFLSTRTHKFIGQLDERSGANAFAGQLPSPIAPDPADPDPIATAVERGILEAKPGLATPIPVIRAARRLFSRDGASASPDEALAQILGFVEAYPHDEQLQDLANRMLQRSSFRRFASWSIPPARPPAIGDVDPIGSAVKRGSAAAGQDDSPPPALLKAAGRYFSRDGWPDYDPDEALAEILGFIEVYPNNERLQLFAGRMLERSSRQEAAIIGWSGVSERFPRSTTAFTYLIARMKRDRGAEAAHSWLLSRFPVLPENQDDLANYAVGFSQINEFELADQAHEMLLVNSPQREDVYLLYASSLERRGEHDRAARILEQGREVIGQPRTFSTHSARLAQRSAALRSAFPELAKADGAGNREILQLFLREAARHRKQPEPASGRIGRILLIGGSLAAGGAERQFVATALRLQAATQGSDRVAGLTVAGPVSMLCQSLTSRDGAAFFLDAVTASGIPVADMSSLPDISEQNSASCVDPYRRFLDFLPRRIADGVRLLSDAIREQAPEVVHIWQDGMVLSAAAAAIVAGVPRIVLSMRTMPPIDRLGRKKPEYETLYRELLAMPGVTMTANSARAAARYAEWLEVPAERIPVVRNGVQQLPDGATEATAALDVSFAARTEPAAFTLGCVMRFDENKRPGVWLDTARRVLDAIPDARFILVGDGPLWEIAKERAGALGLAERTLFVGRSAEVGFWLSRMSVFLLLSHVEGLPNGTIEAQLAGVPVVTTPAGGAAETILPGKTGVVLPNADSVDPDEIATLLISLANDPERLRAMSREAAAWAERTFSSETMISATVKAYSA